MLVIALRDYLEHLKPTDEEVKQLALRETDPALAAAFEPITRGRLFAILAIGLVGLAALPSCLVRLGAGVLRGGQSSR